MNVLSLDCATHTGYASYIDGHIETGVQDFSKRRGESNGILFLRFRGWLKAFKDADIKVISYELSHMRGGAATEISVNLTGRVQEFAASIGAEYLSVHTGTLKKFITGSGKGTKEQIMDWFEKTTGRKPISDDESDALACLFYTLRDLGIDPPIMNNRLTPKPRNQGDLFS